MNTSDINDHVKDGQLDDEQIVLYTHGIRKKMVTSLIINNEVPNDDKKFAALGTILNDMDRTAISLKRIKSDKEANTNMAGSAAAVAQLLSQLSPASFKSQATPVENFKGPTLGDDIPRPTVNEGELDVGTSSLNFETFSKEHFQDNTEA